MLGVGLTGGIGCGKSAVADAFADLGVPVIDADRIAHALVEPPSPALDEIVDAFGADILLDDGRLDRRALREQVFADPGARRRLEAILHPRVRETLRREREALDAPYCILVIPLLFESGLEDTVDRVLAVDCPEALQIERVTGRDGVDEAAVRAVMAAQISRSERRARADDLIDNAGTVAELRTRVSELHAKYLAMARE